jgi:electron transfer flavoprotein alpha subunit
MSKNGVLVYSEDSELQLQLLGKGVELAEKLGSELYSVILGSEIENFDVMIKHGADKVYVVDRPGLNLFALEPYRAALIEIVKVVSPEIIIIGATKRGKELAARIAAALDTGCMTECIELDLDDEGRLLAQRLTYGGSSIAKEMSRKSPHIATVPPRVFQKSTPKKRTGEVVRVDLEVPTPRVTVVERKEKSRSDTGLEDAPIIISAGRGFREKEDLKIIEELAEILEAKIGCSRPISADNGWLDEWIGISGRKVTPRLYLACGISGTVQHAAGIKDAQIIVSINKDENANIFELSDYGIIGDIYKVLPALIKAFEAKL